MQRRNGESRGVVCNPGKLPSGGAHLPARDRRVLCRLTLRRARAHPIACASEYPWTSDGAKCLDETDGWHPLPARRAAKGHAWLAVAGGAAEVCRPSVISSFSNMAY